MPSTLTPGPLFKGTLGHTFEDLTFNNGNRAIGIEPNRRKETQGKFLGPHSLIGSPTRPQFGRLTEFQILGKYTIVGVAS